MTDDPRSVFAVRLRQGQSFECEAHHSVLEGMTARGRTGIAVGCRGGGCGVCKVRVLDGRYRTGAMSAACVTPEDRNHGIALACKLFPESDLSLQVLGKIGVVLNRTHRGAFDPCFGYRAAVAGISNQSYEEK